MPEGIAASHEADKLLDEPPRICAGRLGVQRYLDVTLAFRTLLRSTGTPRFSVIENPTLSLQRPKTNLEITISLEEY